MRNKYLGVVAGNRGTVARYGSHESGIYATVGSKEGELALIGLKEREDDGKLMVMICALEGFTEGFRWNGTFEDFQKLLSA